MPTVNTTMKKLKDVCLVWTFLQAAEMFEKFDDACIFYMVP
jgi:hypothetical protein